MSEPRSVAAAYGICVEITDLGSWTPATLISEYDARARAIRVNARVLDDYRRACGAAAEAGARAFIDRAIAHELYHVSEAAGECPRLTTRQDREAAADAHARASLPADARLDAFIAALTKL